VTPNDSSLATALAGRYTVERELGQGGMATVYLAHDVKHDRPVALKVMHPELAATLGPERFLREIKLAARLQHPHILTVLDSGETAGRFWYTMPFVEGRAADAVREGERAVALRPPEKDATEGPALVANLARIDVLAGRLDEAVDHLERVLSNPGPLSRPWLRADPTFAPLRGNPRFERLVSGP